MDLFERCIRSIENIANKEQWFGSPANIKEANKNAKI